MYTVRLIPISLVFMFCLSFVGCIEMNNPYPMVAPGIWRGELDLRPPQSRIQKKEKTTPSTEFDMRDTPTGILPFNFEVSYISDDSLAFHLINGKDTQSITSYRFKSNVLGAKDSLILQFPIFDTELRAYVQEGIMQGEWIVHYRNNYRIPFEAYLGQDYRFTNNHQPPATDLTGRWKVTFTESDGTVFPAIGHFEQNGNQLLGTFETETGDYRYLEGSVEGKQILLSTFDGAHAFLYDAEWQNDTLTGRFYSGNHYIAQWVATKEADFALNDGMQNGNEEKFSFVGRSIDMGRIDFTESAYDDQIKIIQIMGTWCPNCYDETKFLQSWKEEHPDLPVTIVSVAVERHQTIAKNIALLKSYKDRMGIDWPIIYGGRYDSPEPLEKFPFLDQIKAYPTLLFLDRENRIQKIHTGFNGPATIHYKDFKQSFNHIIKELISKENQ